MHRTPVAPRAIRFATVTLATALLASSAYADFNWDSKRNKNGDPNAQGFWSLLGSPGNRDQSRSSNNYSDNQVDGVPSQQFADYFNSDAGATMYWTNLSIPALSPGQFIATESRAGDYNSQEFRIDFYPANSPDGTAPLFTSYTKRMRWNTSEDGSFGGWQRAAWNYQPYVNLGTVPAGNYDIKVSGTANAGGHFAGFGVWAPQYTGPAAGKTLRIEAENYSWSNGEKYQQTDGSATFSGTGYLNQPLNSDGGNGYIRDWIDYEIYNPRPGRKYTLTLATRSGNSDPAVYELQGLNYNGDIINFGTPLVSLTAQGSGGWEGTPFVRTTSVQFELPSGQDAFPLVRLTKISGGGQHIDYLELTAAPSAWKDVSGMWDTTDNWSDEVPSGAGTNVSFPATTDARTVGLPADRTVAGVTLDSSSPYTFSGPGKLVLQGDAYTKAGITVASGSHMIATPVVLADNASVTVPSGSVLSVNSLTTTSSANTLSVSGGGVLRLTGTSGDGTVSTSGPLTVAGDGSLVDLRKGGIVLSGMSEGAVRDLVKQFLGGNGGLGSSSVNASTTLGVFPNDEGLIDEGVANGVPYFTSFGGVSDLTASAILVRYTYIGDVNLDGVVDGQDYRIASESSLFGRTGWAAGDVDYNDVVNDADLAALSAQFGLAQIGLPSGDPVRFSAIPEPTAVALMPAAALLSSRRRRA